MRGFRNIKDGMTVAYAGRRVSVVIGYQPSVTMHGEPAIVIQEDADHIARYVSIHDVSAPRRTA
jgi:hypothetical protein